jgi:hypothetical protein
MPRLLIHLSGEQDLRRKANTQVGADAEGAAIGLRNLQDSRSLFRLHPRRGGSLTSS